jgi:hypothetical protein
MSRDWYFPKGLREAQPDDGRLRVLWVEDNRHIIPSNWGPFAEWLSVVVVESTIGMRNLVDAAKEAQRTRGGQAGENVLFSLPSDVYVTDFRLCKKVNQGCNDSHHESSGMHAPSAGFLLGVLTALHWPDYPQAIVPYSTEPKEFGQIWQLSKLVCPPSIVVSGRNEGKADLQSLGPEAALAESDQPSKAMDVDTGHVLRRSSQLFRKAIDAGMQSGSIYMPLAEHDQLRTLIAGAPAGIAAHQRFALVGEFGVRSVLIGALFLGEMMVDRPVVPAKVVEEWLDTIPLVDPLVRKARDISAWYWHLRSLQASKYMYQIIRDRTEGRVDAITLPSPPHVEWLFKYMKKKRTDGLRLARLSLLFLMIREWHARELAKVKKRLIDERVLKVYSRLLAQREINEDEDVVFASIAELAIEEGWELDTAEEYLANAEALFLSGLGMGTDSAGVSSVIDDYVLGKCGVDNDPTSDVTLIRLVDPLPGTYDVPLDLNSNRYTKNFASLWSSTGRGITPFRNLLDGDASCLESSERIAIRHFASELMPKGYGFEWPPFVD